MVKAKLEEHGKMLRWIERQRKEMVAEQAASVHATTDPEPAKEPVHTHLS
jgi:hypothetical protein